MHLKNKLHEKFLEALAAVLPIVLMVVLLSLTVSPIPSGTMLSFLFGSSLLILGMMFFSIGAEVAMEPMGSSIGSKITRTKNLRLILFLGFLLGVLITISEPDLQVLAEQVQAIPSIVLILFVGIGVGLFLVLALVRILYGISLHLLLVVLYCFLLGFVLLVPENFRAIAFDSGGVTTGPMTVPFIMSFGVGIAAIRSDRNASNDSFGLISLCSIGPILAVLILSLIFRADGASQSPISVTNVTDTQELSLLFGNGLPVCLREMLVSILPITIAFFVLNFLLLHLSGTTLGHISIGILYTYFGLTVFMTGARFGFMPAGMYLGQRLGAMEQSWIIIPVGVIIGTLVVRAEPAVYVLMHQVEDLTNGEISGKSLQLSMCLGVGVSVGLSMFRVMAGINILNLLIPGYVLAILFSFISPRIFTAIAFDSGGVASGPMTATFLLPMTMGCCLSTGGNIATDAFGVVALVAMTPLLTIQGLGIIYRFRHLHRKPAPVTADLFADLPDDAIIEL